MSSPFDFHTINLATHAALCVKFREDSYIVSFGTAAAFHESDGNGSSRYLEWLKVLILEFPTGFVHVWDNDRIIGQLEMRRSKGDAEVGYVNLFYLIPEYRGKGHGRLLDDYAGRFFGELGCSSAQLSVSPTNTAALKFYTKHNWRVLGMREGRSDVMLMEKRY